MSHSPGTLRGVALSKSAVDKLGDRLRKGTATDADWDLLEATGRVKTTNTLVDKLERGRIRLGRMDDVAGARIKVEGGRIDQDAVVAQLLAVWPDARTKDRRAQPMHGYRAVHVIPSVDGWPLEVQIRTRRQDALANILESLGDDWGRQIRYGSAPDLPDVVPFPADQPHLTRMQVLEVVQVVAEMVSEAEEQRLRHDILRLIRDDSGR